MKSFLIATPTDFEKALRYLRACREIAIDLEFDNNRYTYGLNLCLVQVADRSECFLIDPFAISDLRPLWEILEDNQTTKILHSASSDILLLKTLGCQPRNLVDTEIAIRILNYHKTSLAYALQVNLGIDLDKSLQVSNWNTRPLTWEQLQYAASDVTHLHALKDHLMIEVQRLARLPWFEEECRYLELLENKENPDPHLRLREANRLTYYQQFILKCLYQWRGELAKKFNKPSAFIIPNDVLVALALKPVTNLDEWSNSKGLFRVIKDQAFFQKFQGVIQVARQQAEAQQIPHRVPPSYRRTPSTLSEAEMEKRKQAGSVLRKALIERYGDTTASLILSQSVVNEYYQGANLVVRRQYALEIIQHLAEELNINLAILHLESGSSAE